MGRPFLTDDDRETTIARIDGLGRTSFTPQREEEIIRHYPVSPQYEKGEQLQHPKREKAREMPVMQLCARMVAIMAVVILMAVGVSAAPEQANPILSLHTQRLGTFDVLTTVHILPSAENMAVCVGLSGEHYHVRWGCQFVPDEKSTTVTIHWSDVPHEDYAIDAGLWKAKRPVLTGSKVSLTYRRAFGVWRL